MRTSLRIVGVIMGAAGSLSAATFRLTEATIADTERAMADGGISSVELTALYLNRVFVYDRGRLRLNAVAQINPAVFDEAAAMDHLRARDVIIGPLQGLPILVKDSYDVAGLASSAGATPLKHLMGRVDAPIVRALKGAGAIILGKSNMWPFAYANPDVPLSSYAWGEARNPYTLVEDFGGSSTGSAAATAANLCAFAMGGDTGSSIRLPCARTSLVGGRPSQFLVPGSGTWPLETTIDVLGPMTRTVTDQAVVMDVVVFDDPAPLDTNFFPLSSSVRPRTYTASLRADALRGKVVGLPRPYIGRDLTGEGKPLDPKIQPVWDAATQRLVSLGATVKEIDWPYFHNALQDTPSGIANGFTSVGLDATQARLWWRWADAYYFNEHLKAYHDKDIPNVFALPNPTQPPRDSDTIGKFKEFVREGKARSFTSLGFRAYFAAYRAWAKRDVEDVMAAAGVDLLAFPVSGSDSESDEFSFMNGINEGSFLGLPQLSVPMGFAAGSGRPQGMMLMARTYYTEPQILGFAYAFEQAGPLRHPPALTPPLPGETINYRPAPPQKRPEINPPTLTIRTAILRIRSRFLIRGTALDASGLASVRVFINGRRIPMKLTPSWTAGVSAKRLRKLSEGARKVSVMVLAKDIHGNASGRLAMLRVPTGKTPSGHVAF